MFIFKLIYIICGILLKFLNFNSFLQHQLEVITNIKALELVAITIIMAIELGVITNINVMELVVIASMMLWSWWWLPVWRLWSWWWVWSCRRLPVHRFTGYGAGVSVILCIHHQLHNPLLLWIISTGYHGAGGDDYIISNLEIMYLLVTISSIILELLMSATIVKNYK